MASVNWKKCKAGTGDACAMMRHADKVERLKHEHSNKDINKQLTKNNFHLTFDGTANSFEGKYKRFRNRLEQLDVQPGANKRKDRVEMFALEIPAPKELPQEKFKAWSISVAGILKTNFGLENICYLDGHLDEIHAYVDALTKEQQESRPHLHVGVIPVVDGKLNGKKFSSKKNINSLNNAIDKMTREKFGTYFMDGTKKKSMGTVEELKGASMKDALTLKKEIENLQAQKQELQITNAKLKSENVSIQKEVQEFKVHYEQSENMGTFVEEQKVLGKTIRPSGRFLTDAEFEKLRVYNNDRYWLTKRNEELEERLSSANKQLERAEAEVKESKPYRIVLEAILRYIPAPIKELAIKTLMRSDYRLKEPNTRSLVNRLDSDSSIRNKIYAENREKQQKQNNTRSMKM